MSSPREAAPADDTIAMLRESAAAFLADRHSTKRLRSLRETDTGYDRRMWRELAELGWLGMRIPEDAGGLGLTPAHLAALGEEIGAALLPEPVLAGALLPGGVLARSPIGARRDRLIEELVAGRQSLALAWQEEVGVIEPKAARVSTERSGAGLALSGAKCFVAAAPGADGLLVLAADAGEPVIVHLEQGAAGLSLAPRRQVDGSMAADVVFERVAFPADAVLLRGAAAQAAVDASLTEAQLATAAMQSGVARRALEITVEYSKTRVQFDRPIGSFQALQHRMVDLAIQCRLAQAAVARAGRVASGPGEAGSPSARASIAAARAVATETSLRVTRESIQLHGGIGFTDEADIGLFLRSALRLAGWLGGPEVHRERFLAIRTGEGLA